MTDGDKLAVVNCDPSDPRVFTYEKLYDRTMRLASALRAAGVAAGDSVVRTSRRLPPGHGPLLTEQLLSHTLITRAN